MSRYSGYNLVSIIRQLEHDADELGLKIVRSEAYMGNVNSPVALVPKNVEVLPVYRKNAELFSGSIDEAVSWIEGVKWARTYDSMVFGNKHDERRAKCEQNIRNEALVQMISESV